ncbi:hypothetical protein CK203_113085 [Vitis vinifera]|uniref:Uncharacterized protein n=1 Tax=Vitis vinifera TaxID=29760 RepID=A0A438FDG3_VITVI|nr:hypothetical protein CK203_113085 [Vitis vinifera]
MGEESLGWSVDRMRLKGFYSALCKMWKPMSIVLFFQRAKDSIPPLSSFKGWVHARWALRGGLRISKLGRTCQGHYRWWPVTPTLQFVCGGKSLHGFLKWCQCLSLVEAQGEMIGMILRVVHAQVKAYRRVETRVRGAARVWWKE